MILALVAIAGTIPGKGPTCTVTVTTPALLKGIVLKPGDYRVTVGADKVTFTLDRQSQDIPAKIETGATKFDVNRVQYDEVGGKTVISQIALGGTKIRVIFN
jgi:hypothetical protein